MSNEKNIILTFDLEQVANDILTKCNLISISIRDEAMEDIRANVQEPDNPETRSIINRAVTEAFGNVKAMCQRYLKTGRTIDNNLLERMVTNVTYTKATRQVQAYDEAGHPIYIGQVGGAPTEVYRDGDTWKTVDGGAAVTIDQGTTPTKKMVSEEYTTDNISSLTYEKVTLNLFIPNFNVSVTDALKSDIHKYVVDYTMGRFLQDQLADKAAEYKGLADGEDRDAIIRHLNARERWNMRKPSWI